jgi:hypothetical protein
LSISRLKQVALVLSSFKPSGKTATSWQLVIREEIAMSKVKFRGQTLRVSLANFIRLDGRDQTPLEVRLIARLVDAHGQIIAQPPEVSVTNNQVWFFEFNRDRLAPTGEARTGRLQLREELTVRCIGVNTDEALTIKQRSPEFLPVSSEVIDNATGKSQAVDPCMPPDKWLQATSGWKPTTIGLTYGQTLRFSALNPDQAGQLNAAIRVRVRLSDTSGNLIAQSDAIIIPPGEFHSFDFNRDDLRLSGDAGTGRLQVVWGVEGPTPGNLPNRFLASIEPVDNSTGLSPTSRIAYAYQATPLN